MTKTVFTKQVEGIELFIDVTPKWYRHPAAPITTQIIEEVAATPLGKLARHWRWGSDHVVMLIAVTVGMELEEVRQMREKIVEQLDGKSEVPPMRFLSAKEIIDQQVEEQSTRVDSAQAVPWRGITGGLPANPDEIDPQ